ncbi:hypothetical protein FGO68_gene12367 [Halteria grandinella]|uniref:Uncharacterized protein n=1 Tax=Halteria grandinella TaxID=5974 RepID=A0A8J8SVG0_HALGN|nr:hypothetical protein FGO68_gene12367 [Halteria grandinella]
MIMEQLMMIKRNPHHQPAYAAQAPLHQPPPPIAQQERPPAGGARTDIPAPPKSQNLKETVRIEEYKRRVASLQNAKQKEILLKLMNDSYTDFDKNYHYVNQVDPNVVEYDTLKFTIDYA